MNFWIGCAKYWFEPGHTYASSEEYTAEQLDALKKIPEGKPFNLVMPLSAGTRLMSTYTALPEQSQGPDVFIMTSVITDYGYVPKAPYQEVYKNEVFSVYTKPSGLNTSRADSNQQPQALRN